MSSKLSPRSEPGHAGAVDDSAWRALCVHFVALMMAKDSLQPASVTFYFSNSRKGLSISTVPSVVPLLKSKYQNIGIQSHSVSS